MTVAVIVVVIIIVVTVKIASIAMNFADKHTGAILVAKWLAGHHRGKTDATFFKPGTKVLHPSGNASRWAHRSHFYRLCVRWGILAGIAGGLYGWFTARTETEICLALVFLALVTVGQYRGYRAVKLASHRKGTLNPLRTAVAEQLGMSEKAAIDSVSLRPDFATVTEADARLGTIVLPDNWQSNPIAQDSMRVLLEARLGSNIDLSWRTARSPFTLVITRTPQPPSIVHLSQYLDAIAELPDDKVMLGIDGRVRPVCWDIQHENPHMFTVGPSRIGKTRLLLLIICQILAQGGSALVIDPKRVGVKDIIGSHPRVEVYRDQRDVELMWKAVHEARMLLEDRIDQFDNGKTDFTRHIVAIDEISLFSEMSKSTWDVLRSSNESKTPPVWTNLKAIAYAGAQFKVNLIFFGQSINERILPNMVGQFGTRIMGGYSKRDFDRLVGITPVIPAPRGKGRFLFHDGHQRVFQSLLGSDDELRNLAFGNLTDTEEIEQTA